MPAPRIPYIAKALSLAFVGICLAAAVADAMAPGGSMATIPIVATAVAVLLLSAGIALAAGVFAGSHVERATGSPLLAWTVGIVLFLALGIGLRAGAERLPWVGKEVQAIGSGD